MKSGSEVPTPVVVVILVLVVGVAGFFLYRAVTHKEEAKIDPNSPPIQAMRDIGKMAMEQGHKAAQQRTGSADGTGAHGGVTSGGQ